MPITRSGPEGQHEAPDDEQRPQRPERERLVSRPPGRRSPGATGTIAAAIAATPPAMSRRLRLAAIQRQRRARQRCEQAGHRTRQRCDATQRTAAERGRRRSRRERRQRHAAETECEGQPAAQQLGDGRGAEPGRAEPGVVAVDVVGQRLERRRGADARERRHQLRVQQPGERREQHAVAGRRSGRRTTSCSRCRSPRRRTASRAAAAPAGRRRSARRSDRQPRAPPRPASAPDGAACGPRRMPWLVTDNVRFDEHRARGYGR